MATIKKEQHAKRMRNRRKTETMSSTLKSPLHSNDGDLPIMRSAHDVHHDKITEPEVKTTLKFEAVKKGEKDDDPLITIENIKRAIAGIEETVKRTGIYSKASRRRKNELLRQLQLAQLSLVPVINVKPCSKPVLLEARSTSAVLEFKTPKLRLRTHKITGFEVHYCTGRALVQLSAEAERQKRLKKQQKKHGVEVKVKDNNQYLKKQLIWKSGKVIGFARSSSSERGFRYTLEDLPAGEAVVVKVRARFKDKGWSPWSTESNIFQTVDGRTAKRCDKPIAKTRTLREVILTWPAPAAMGIYEYCVEQARSKGLHPRDIETDSEDEQDAADPNQKPQGTGNGAMGRDEQGSKEENDEYEEPYDLDELHWESAINHTVATNSAVLKNLKNGVNYRFRIRSRNDFGWSAPGKISEEINLLPSPPSAPLAPLKQSVTERTITIRWNEPELNGSSRIESYEIKMGTDKNGWGLYNKAIRSQYGEFHEPITPANLLTLSRTGTAPSTGLTPASIDGRPCTSDTVYSLASTTAPSEGMIQEIEEGLYWQTIQVNIRAEAETVGTGSLTKYCFYSIGNLAPDTGYKLRVRAVAAKGHSPWSKASKVMYTQQEIIDIRQMIWDAKSEGPEAIVALMCDEKYLKHSALQCRAIRGLRSVAITSKDGRHRVLKADAQHTIVEAMKNHEDNHHVVRWGCRALTSLIDPDGKDSSQLSHKRPSVPLLGNGERENGDGVVDVSQNIFMLNQPSASEVIAAMVRMKSNAAVQQWASQFIVALCQKQPNGSILVGKAPGALDAVVGALRLYLNNVKIIEQALQALYVIAQAKESSRQLACDLDAQGIVTGILARYELNPAVVNHAQNCLAALKPPSKVRAIVSRGANSPNALMDEEETKRNKEIKDASKILKRPTSAKTYNSMGATSSKWSGSTEISLASIGSMLADRLRPDELEFFQRMEFELMSRAIELALEQPPVEFFARADPEEVVADRLSLAIKNVKGKTRPAPVRSKHNGTLVSRFPIIAPKEEIIDPLDEAGLTVHEEEEQLLLHDDHEFFQQFRHKDEAFLLRRLERHLRLSEEETKRRKKANRKRRKEESMEGVGSDDDYGSDTNSQYRSEDEERPRTGHSSTGIEGEFKLGDIIDMTQEEQLAAFLQSYKGFTMYKDVLARDGFDDMESLIHAELDDLNDILPDYVAKRIYTIVRRERVYWKKIYNVQRKRKQLERDERREEEERRKREEGEYSDDGYSWDEDDDDGRSYHHDDY